VNNLSELICIDQQKKEERSHYRKSAGDFGKVLAIVLYVFVALFLIGAIFSLIGVFAGVTNADLTGYRFVGGRGIRSFNILIRGERVCNEIYKGSTKTHEINYVKTQPPNIREGIVL
jgi:hypothetical protein